MPGFAVKLQWDTVTFCPDLRLLIGTEKKRKRRHKSQPPRARMCACGLDVGVDTSRIMGRTSVAHDEEGGQMSGSWRHVLCRPGSCRPVREEGPSRVGDRV